jgi:hypothetical protein
MRIRQEGGGGEGRNFVDSNLSFTGPNETAYALLYVETVTGTGEIVTAVRIRFDDTNVAFGGGAWGAATGAQAWMEVYDGATLLGTQPMLGGTSDDGPNFLGYLLTDGDTATSIRFVAGTFDPDYSAEGFIYDDLAGVRAVPEAASLPSLSLGLTWLARRLRKRTS